MLKPRFTLNEFVQQRSKWESTKSEKTTKCRSIEIDRTELLYFLFVFRSRTQERPDKQNKQLIKSILVILYFITFMDFVLSRFGQVYIQLFWVILCLSIQDDTVYNNVW